MPEQAGRDLDPLVGQNDTGRCQDLYLYYKNLKVTNSDHNISTLNQLLVLREPGNYRLSTEKHEAQAQRQTT